MLQKSSWQRSIWICLNDAETLLLGNLFSYKTKLCLRHRANFVLPLHTVDHLPIGSAHLWLWINNWVSLSLYQSSFRFIRFLEFPAALLRCAGCFACTFTLRPTVTYRYWSMDGGAKAVSSIYGGQQSTDELHSAPHSACEWPVLLLSTADALFSLARQTSSACSCLCGWLLPTMAWLSLAFTFFFH